VFAAQLKSEVLDHSILLVGVWDRGRFCGYVSR